MLWFVCVNPFLARAPTAAFVLYGVEQLGGFALAVAAHPHGVGGDHWRGNDNADDLAAEGLEVRTGAAVVARRKAGGARHGNVAWNTDGVFVGTTESVFH